MQDADGDIALVEGLGYLIVARRAFDAVIASNDGFRLIAEASGGDGEFVLYDPEDDHSGFLLFGDDRAALAAEAIRVLELRTVATELFGTPPPAP